MEYDYITFNQFNEYVSTHYPDLWKELEEATTQTEGATDPLDRMYTVCISPSKPRTQLGTDPHCIKLINIYNKYFYTRKGKKIWPIRNGLHIYEKILVYDYNDDVSHPYIFRLDRLTVTGYIYLMKMSDLEIGFVKKLQRYYGSKKLSPKEEEEKSHLFFKLVIYNNLGCSAMQEIKHRPNKNRDDEMINIAEGIFKKWEAVINEGIKADNLLIKSTLAVSEDCIQMHNFISDNIRSSFCLPKKYLDKYEKIHHLLAELKMDIENDR